MAQLSRMALLVPVLTAAHVCVDSGLDRPKVSVLAIGSAKISAMIKQALLLKTCLGGCSVLAFRESSDVKRVGLHWPLFARARYAFVSCNKLVSAPPNAKPNP